MAGTLQKQLQSMSAEWLLKINLASSLYMTGVIWFVQIVHYPLFERIGSGNFTSYEEQHQKLTTRVVAPAMLLELVASIAQVVLTANPSPALWIASSMTLLVWASTMAIQVPMHARLASGFKSATWKTLVASNWIRTIAWTIRSVVLLWMI